MESIASSQADERHHRLLQASWQLDEARIRDILSEESLWTSQADRDALRQALQRAAGRGNLPVVRLLLKHGAEIDTTKDTEIPAIMRASDSGHAAVLAELLAHEPKPNMDLRNKRGFPPLFTACHRGYTSVMEVWFKNGISARLRNNNHEGLTPLLYLAWEKSGKWQDSTVQLLLKYGADIEERDFRSKRTPLMWAALNGGGKLAELLLNGKLGIKARIGAVNKKDETALHIAAKIKNRTDMVTLLLNFGANPEAKANGGWRPLHVACQEGRRDCVEILLNHGVNVNAGLNNGMTAVHWAAFQGHADIVELLLRDPSLNVSIKDNFDRTPLLCAAEGQHEEIIDLLSPWRTAHRLSAPARLACENFEATIVDFASFTSDKSKKHIVIKKSVYELLYGWDEKKDKPSVPTQTRNVDSYQPRFRWIHLPSNNLAWVETLLAKIFIEAGHFEIESFKALAKCFDQEHRGNLPHAHFMRPFAHRMPNLAADMADKIEKPLVTVSEEPSDVSALSSQASQHGSSTGPESGTPKLELKKKKSKADQLSERHPKHQKRGTGPPGNAPGSKMVKQGLSRSSTMGSTESIRLMFSTGKLVLFMPFLHYETDENRRRMSSVINRVELGKEVNNSPDARMLQAYLKSNPRMHPRRTLDQYVYHGFDTSERDQDQVVWRYCRDHHKEKKVFMVDQLWLWTFGRDLVVSCFPQRWEQPRQDPLNVLEGIIEDSNAKTRPPIQSIYDLAMLITSRCCGMFDRHRLDNQEYQFLDMFESSIGNVTDQESKLFSRFNDAARDSSRLLRNYRSTTSTIHENLEEDEISLDELLDIGKETSLLTETMDIRDELRIIRTILESQKKTLSEFEGHIIDELRTDGSRRSMEGIIYDIRKRSKEQARLLETHVNDIDRMDSQARDIYNSLTNLLDLKQKHSNALEARFARDQAVIAGKQGQTIMVFTIVTITFLPMSVIAAFFAINLPEWEDLLTIGYVSKYMFGIGLSMSALLIAMAFTFSDVFNALGGLFRRIQKKVRPSESHKHRRTHSGDLPKKQQDDADYVYEKPRPVSEGISLRRKWIDNGLSPILHPSRDDRPGSGLSPSSARGRGWSIGSAWVRPSFDRARATKTSDDLERGGSSSRR